MQLDETVNLALVWILEASERESNLRVKNEKNIRIIRTDLK